MMAKKAPAHKEKVVGEDSIFSRIFNKKGNIFFIETLFFVIPGNFFIKIFFLSSVFFAKAGIGERIGGVVLFRGAVCLLARHGERGIVRNSVPVCIIAEIKQRVQGDFKFGCVILTESMEGGS